MVQLVPYLQSAGVVVLSVQEVHVIVYAIQPQTMLQGDRPRLFVQFLDLGGILFRDALGRQDVDAGGQLLDQCLHLLAALGGGLLGAAEIGFEGIHIQHGQGFLELARFKELDGLLGAGGHVRTVGGELGQAHGGLQQLHLVLMELLLQLIPAGGDGIDLVPCSLIVGVLHHSQTGGRLLLLQLGDLGTEAVDALVVAVEGDILHADGGSVLLVGQLLVIDQHLRVLQLHRHM